MKSFYANDIKYILLSGLILISFGIGLISFLFSLAFLICFNFFIVKVFIVLLVKTKIIMQIVITLVVIFSCLKIILSLIRINPFKSIKNITIVDKYRLNEAKFIFIFVY